ncbi:MAG TPA: AMP-binding protein [Candidatus Dormibacteraeota bacterium]|nr:AMP-binding protein [Candidatus Dormibacteraeota bacterium]
MTPDVAAEERQGGGGTRPSPFRQELTPVSFLERAGTVHANRVAVIDGGARYTWAGIRARARRLASALRSRGLRPGDRVAFLALNSEPLLTAHFAVPMAGGVIVAINTRLSADEIAYIVSHSGSRFLFLSPELAPLAGSVPDPVERCLLGDEFEHVLSTGSEAPIVSWLATEDDLCAIDYTSGTTGRPKGVMYHHRGAYLNALGMVIEEGLTAASNYLWTLPMFHCNGWSHTWAVAAAGSASTCIPRVDPPAVWALLTEGAITHFNAAPTVLIMLANDAAARRLHQRVRVCTGGAPPSPTLIAQMERFNIELVHLYGLTETYGPLTINVPPPDLSSDAETVASYKARQGFPHVTAGLVQIVDDDLRPVPADGRTLGEVVARGNTLMAGYLDEPEETARAYAGGWLHTGDVGVVHPDGSVELRDRKKDIIISGGENISTIEVEQAVMSHPAVLEAAVIAIPDGHWGEVPKAFVTLKPGAAATAAEIIEHVRSRIAHFKAPKHVWFGELPKTSTGKIQKYVLREREWEPRGSRIH